MCLSCLSVFSILYNRLSVCFVWSVLSLSLRGLSDLSVYVIFLVCLSELSVRSDYFSGQPICLFCLSLKSVSLSLRLFVCLSVCLVCLCALCVSLVCLSVCLVCLSLRLYVMSIYVSVTSVSLSGLSVGLANLSLLSYCLS